MEAGGDARRSAAVQRMLSKRQYVKECKFKIAQYSSSIMQDTNENIGRLSDLTRMATDPLFLKSSSLRQLLVASLCVVFKDILPTYKIRPPTEQELKQRTKGGESSQRASTFILYLSGLRYPPELVCALKCACSLFENNPLFNFASDLLGAFLPYLQKGSSSVRQVVFKSLKATFASDSTGEATLLVCRGVHRLARKVNYRIRPDVASAIANIAIKEVSDPSIDNKAARRNRKLASRRERKKDKILAKFEKDQAESKASKSHEERLRINTEILKEILFVYFKVLKTTKDSDLLSAVLAGLSTYAHVINVEYVENLLQLMSNFVSNPKTSLQDGLNSVHTALTIFNTSSAASVLRVDPTRFYNHLYALLGCMAGVCNRQIGSPASGTVGSSSNLLQYSWARTPAALAAETLVQRERLLAGGGERDEGNGSVRSIGAAEVEGFTDVILACLDMLLVSRRREVSATRVLAFVKRLASLTLVVADTACLASMLVSLWKFFSLFSKCEVLFDSDTEIGGPYDPEANDPELARPASAALWELHALRTHESPLIQKIIALMLKWVRQTVKDGAPRPTNEVIAAPDHTLESLSAMHPAERRLVLARAEAACLSKPTTTAARRASTSKGYVKQISPWLRELMAKHDVAAPGSGDRGFHKLRREILWRLFVQIWRTDDCLVFVGVLLEAGGVPFFYIGTVSHGFVEDLSAHIVCSAKRTLSWLNLPRLTTGGFERRPMLATSYKRVLLS
ncbi:Nucleolar complex protein [Echinococcus granulosus]|uniref:NOC3-like protein n=1 Tax=Echinococcus granulosus TaxID=6210 RepID=W6UDA8_ECHGR|nr:Nucleolar complex protein [Echinococcus granulosus]EUB58801.1 Nucleolar complex protein [Echinococcus granulosus]